MGRWRYDEHGWMQAEEQQESIESIDEAMRFHHADCDAYEARIAELEAIGVNLQQQAVEHYQAKLAADRLLLASAEETRLNFNGLLDARAELARVKAESLRVVKINEPCSLSSMERVGIDGHTNTCTVEGADWRIYAAERRVDDSGHRYLMPVSDEWPPIAFGPDTKVQPVRLERWEMEE